MSQYIGRYPVAGVLGSGGFGTVYLGTDPVTGEPVAVKVLDAAGDPGARTHLWAEAAALAAVVDPHVVRVRDVIDEPELAAIVTDYVEGASLREVVNRVGTLAGPQALGVLAGALRGLIAVHAVGLLHGDLKPGNILVDRTGTSRLIDFGLAAPPRRDVATPGTWTGTPSYLSPEQVLGRPSDQRSDVYACAVILFELLCGRRPFVAEHPDQIAALHVQAPVPHPRTINPTIGSSLADLCLQGLEKDPERRIQSAAALLTSLEYAARERYGAAWATGAGLGGVIGGVLNALPAGSGLLGEAGVAGTGVAAGQPIGASVGAGAGGHGAGTSATAAAAKTGFAAVGTKAAIAGATVLVIGASVGGLVAFRSNSEPPPPQPPAASGPDADDIRAIRAYDFRNATMRDATWGGNDRSGTSITLRDGAAPDPGYPEGFSQDYGAHLHLGVPGKGTTFNSITYDETIRYLDADGDGDQDALVPLSEYTGNDFDTAWYVWLWDQHADAAVQIEHPVAVDQGRCGDTVDSVRVEGSDIVIDEGFKAIGASCADPPSFRQTRRVTVQDGFPVLADGIGGYGGACPLPALGDSSFDAETGTVLDGEPYGAGPPYEFYAGPDSGAPRVENPQLRRFSPITDPPPWLQVDGWTVVQISPTGGDDSNFEPYTDAWSPCAWVRDTAAAR